MKKIGFVVALFVVSLILYFHVNPVIVNSYMGEVEYHELSNGKWQCKDMIYSYKHEFYDEKKD